MKKTRNMKKQGRAYQAPEAKVIEIATEAIFCSSPIFGQEGGPGNDYFDLDDITDGGAF